jgi:Zn-dependent peptidase ImmA (M78 family)
VSEIFAFTRAIGDAVCFPGTRRAVVNDLHNADRQAAARAFAAEFLAPIDEVLSMWGDGADIATIADELNVSTEVVQRQLENQDRIKAACD